jgi:hypothetical protein
MLSLNIDQKRNLNTCTWKYKNLMNNFIRYTQNIQYNDQVYGMAYRTSTNYKWNQMNKITSDKAEKCKWTTICLYIIVTNYSVVNFIMFSWTWFMRI